MSEKEVVAQFSKAQDSLVVQQSDFSLATIHNMVRAQSIDLEPHYQRRDRWPPEKQSALIESFLLNVPVPPVYLSEDEYGSYSVIDGKQRITTIADFLDNRLKLRSLKEFPTLEGQSFDALPHQLKSVLSVRPFIRVITLLKQSDPELKYEVLLRLNTGGEKLKPQEIRNVAYSGSFNDLLHELATNETLSRGLKIHSKKSNAYRNMDDVEHVLRFFTVYTNWRKMGNVLSVEMDEFMADHREQGGREWRDLFETAISRCESLWDQHVFQKPANDGWRAQLISPLYDAEMVACALLSEQKYQSLAADPSAVIAATRELFSVDQDFVKSVTQSTNNSASVRKRVSTMLEMLQSL